MSKYKLNSNIKRKKRFTCSNIYW